MTKAELAELRRESERIIAKWSGQPGARDNAAYRLAEYFLVATLAWTDATPTVPGWYWWHYLLAPMIVLIDYQEGELRIFGLDFDCELATRKGQFAGPIPLPVGDEPDCEGGGKWKNEAGETVKCPTCHGEGEIERPDIYFDDDVLPGGW